MHPLLVDYHSSLEEALSKLIEADEYLLASDDKQGTTGRNGASASASGPSHDVDEDEEDLLLQQDVETVKSMFHAHEQLMNDLAEYESRITELLNEGKVLLDSSYCTQEEKKVIMSQRSELANRWHSLQRRYSIRQSRLHEALMLLQQKQIDNLKAWLISAEDRISNLMDIGPDLQSVQRQLVEYEVRKSCVRFE